jgi:hypothetical protein
MLIDSLGFWSLHDVPIPWFVYFYEELSLLSSSLVHQTMPEQSARRGIDSRHFGAQ